MTSKENNKKPPLLHLVAGGCAGFVESSICHPLDTIKTRLQLRRQSQTIDAIKNRSSLTEPVMRLRSSLSEPLGVLGRGTSWAEPKILHTEGTMQTGGLHEPSLRMNTSNIRPPPVRPISYSGPAVTAPLGPFGTAKRIVQREGFLALYKGLGAVYLGIVPKMAIRFFSFEQYKEALSKSIGNSSSTIFLAGLASGLTEAVLVVTPSEVCKIRMQAQYNSMIDPAQLKHRKYTNVLQTAVTIVREEGIQALYKGLIPTMLRQGCNQAVNFTAYQWIKTLVLNSTGERELTPWQSLLIGGLSGGMGPLANNPLDVVKTRMQKQVVVHGKIPKYSGLLQSWRVIAKEEGMLALWKGITPRLMRIIPGQAITFMTYEMVSSFLYRNNLV